MIVLRKLAAGIAWFAPIQRWTAAVTILFLVIAIGWGVLAVTGISDFNRPPQHTAVAAYQAAQAHDATKLRGLLDKSAQAEFDALSSDQVSALLSRMSHNYTTTSVDYLGVRRYGSYAVVGMTQDFTKDFSTLRVEILVKEGIHWRLEWPLAQLTWTQANLRFDPNFTLGSAGSGSGN